MKEALCPAHTPYLHLLDRLQIVPLLGTSNQMAFLFFDLLLNDSGIISPQRVHYPSLPTSYRPCRRMIQQTNLFSLTITLTTDPILCSLVLV